MADAQVAAVLSTEAHGWCAQRGLSRVRSLWVVLACNAWGESGWNPRAVQPGGGGRGLFQCDIQGGLGSLWLQAGGSVEQLLDPTINTRLILWEAGRQRPFTDALQSGTLGDAIRAFVYWVERPKDKAGDTVERQGFSRHFAGGDYLLTPCSRFG